MTESEKFLDKILTYVDDSDKHWFTCLKADIKAYAKIYHKEQLNLTDVVSEQQSEQYCECEKPTLGKSVSRCGTCDEWFKPLK